LRKHFRKVLRTIDHTPESLAEMGRTLRQHCTDAMERKAEVLRMLAWPEDPAYDQRALERSGIENAWVTGFLIESDEELAEYVRRAA
jgi:hypothetical protein